MKTLPTLQTARLILRPFEMSDAREVQRLAGDKSVAEMVLNIPYPYEDGMAEEWISTQQPRFEAGELANFAVVLREKNALIGSIGLTIQPRFARGALGYWIGKPFWNVGYCAEAGRAVLRYGFETLNLNRIYASHLTRNPASGRVMQKLGMTREGLARQHTRKWEVFEDVVFYGILQSEWKRKTDAEG